MARLGEKIAAIIEQTVYSLPSFGDTFVEDANEGIKVSISGADKMVHEALSEYLVFEDLNTEVFEDHILLTKKSIGEGLTNDKLNDIYKYVISKKDFELTNNFDKLILPFLGASNTKLEIADNAMDVVAKGLDTVLKASGVNHTDFVISESNIHESTVTDVMPNVRIGDTIDITTEQDIKDNFGKYINKLGNLNDIALWLNNNGHIEVEISDTLSDTINGISVNVSLIDGSSKLPNDKKIKELIEKFFTDEDMKAHLGNKKLFEGVHEELGFEDPSEGYFEVNSEFDGGDELDAKVASIDSTSLVYSPAKEIVRVYPGEGEPYLIQPVLNENDANRVLIALNDSDGDSSVLLDQLDDLGMTMVVESINEDTMTRDDIKAIVDVHNVSGKEIAADSITDKMVTDFNKKFVEFLKKYPDFELFNNDYNGEQDDKFVELLIDILGSGNLSIT